MKFFSAAFLALLFAFSAFAQKQAEVVVVSTYLRNAPDAASEKVQTLQKGEKVIYEKSGETDGWLYVSVSNRTVKGWIRKDTIQRIADVEKPQLAAAKTETNKTAAKPPKPEKSSVAAPPKIVEAAPNDSAKPSENSAPVPAAVPTPNEPVEDAEVIRIETEEVSLKVRVVDDQNRAVKNLNHTQFKVYEDDVLQPIASLTTTEVPIVNALLIDNSRSLRSQLGKIIEAGKAIVNSNLPQDETTVVRFVGRDKIEVAQNFTSNKNLLDNALDNLLVEGGQTAIIDAVYQTAKRVEEYQKSGKKEDEKIRAVVLVSDGDDRRSVYQEQELFDFLRSSQVQIFAIGFVGDLSATPDANNVNRQQKAKDFMTRLARETGGKVYFPASIAELPNIAADISSEIRTQYLISYEPTNDRRDGTFRKIKVAVDEDASGEKRIVTARAGRTAAQK